MSANDVEPASVYLFLFCLSYFVKCLSRSFVLVLNWVSVLWSSKRALYILDTSLLSDMYIVNDFSEYMVSLYFKQNF